LPIAQQLICKKCRQLSSVPTLEKTNDGRFFARCEYCDAKNQVVQTGATPSQPGVLPVIGLIR
jgi:transcription elongation factor Elf1